MWAYETTFYQIYPLGFCGAPRENVAPVAEDELAQAANAAPNPDAPIMKIAQWADYLQKLGIGAVLINRRSSLIATLRYAQPAPYRPPPGWGCRLCRRV